MREEKGRTGRRRTDVKGEWEEKGSAYRLSALNHVTVGGKLREEGTAGGSQGRKGRNLFRYSVREGGNASRRVG